MSKKLALITTTFAVLLLLSGTAQAKLLTIDEFLFEGSPLNATRVNGTVIATVSGSVLTLKVKNTMSQLAVAGNGSHNLLTGVGLTLPDSIMITGGSVFATPSTAANFTPPGGWDGNISVEWGYSQPPTSGHLMLGEPAFYNYGLGIGTVTSDIDFAFTTPTAMNNVGGPVNYDGPDFGVYSATLGSSSAGGVESIGDYITINLNLDTTITDGDAFLDAIDAEAVALLFGSPTWTSHITDPITGVPEPATCALLGFTLLGGCGLRLRRRNRKESSTAAS